VPHLFCDLLRMIWFPIRKDHLQILANQRLAQWDPRGKKLSEQSTNSITAFKRHDLHGANQHAEKKV